MTYYDEPANVEHYVKISEGYDGQLLISVLNNHLPDGSSVLELGMGEGKDLKLLERQYQVTGSDASATFINRYLQQNPTADILHLDANTLQTDRQFNALYSNKVLHHLSPEQLVASFQHQALRLFAKGLTLHSFWLGDGADEFAGETLYYYQPDTIIKLLSPNFEVLEWKTYDESEPDDSFYVLSQKREN